MNFLEKVEPHLLSEDLIVQQFVLRALDDYPFVPVNWSEKLLKDAIHSREKETGILIHMDKMPFSEEAIELLIEGLEKSNPDIRHLYQRLLNKLDPELALKYRKEIQPFIEKSRWDFYSLLLEGTEEEIWQSYGSTLAKLEMEEFYNDQLYSQAKLLAKTLVNNGWIDEDEIDLILKEELEKKYFSYKGLLAVYIIRLLKLHKYIPVLVGLLGRDEDILLEEISDTLISFQSDEVVEMTLPYARLHESSIFALSVLSGTKTPFAVSVMKKLMGELQDEEDLSLVFEGLCHQLSIDSLPEIEAYMRNEPTSYIIDIEETAYGFYKVMGLNHPQLDYWKQTALRKQGNTGVIPMSPIAVEPKVGRNDPCPCGSGKKYKKCCGA